MSERATIHIPPVAIEAAMREATDAHLSKERLVEAMLRAALPHLVDVIHLSDPETGPSYCGQPVTLIEAKGGTRPVCQACHRGAMKRVRRMVDEYRNEAVDLRTEAPHTMPCSLVVAGDDPDTTLLRRAAASERSAERHWPADLLLQAADTIDRLQRQHQGQAEHITALRTEVDRLTAVPLVDELRARIEGRSND